ncbi:MAG: class I SAM-dependent methyltransferase [bacterium]
MNTKIAKITTKAIVSTNHPLLYFRSKEAKKQVMWIYSHLKSYIFKKCRLIDVGCGTGKQSFAAEGLGAEVVGIDCSIEAIKFANRIKKEINSNCQFVVGDYTNMLFENDMFDIAVFPKNIVECSYYEIEKLSSEIKRILKKEGKLIVTMKDGLKNISNDKIDSLNNYQTKTGRYNGEISLPDKKKYPYPTYFWTVPFAKYIFSNHFNLIEEKEIIDNYCFLVFSKNK